MKHTVTKLGAIINQLADIRDDQKEIYCPEGECVCNDFDTILDDIRALLERFKNVIAIKDIDWNFIELYMPKYSSCDDILYHDLMTRYLDDELDAVENADDIVTIEKNAKSQYPDYPIKVAVRYIAEEYARDFWGRALEGKENS